MTKWTKRMRIRTKMALVVFAAILLSVGLSGFSIYLYVYPMLSKQIVTDNQTIVLKVGQQVEGNMADIANYAKGIAINRQVQMLILQLEDAKRDDFDYYHTDFQLNDILREYSLLRSGLIADMFVVDEHGHSLDFHGKYAEAVQGSWLKPFREDPSLNGFSQPFEVVTDLGSPETSVIAYVINLYDPNIVTKRLGKLVVLVNQRQLADPMITDHAQGLEILAFDTWGKRVFPIRPGPTDGGADASMASDRDGVRLVGDQYRIVMTLPTSGWEILGLLPKRTVSASMKVVDNVLLTILLICLFLMSLVVYPVVAGMTKPLLKLIRGMRNVSKGKLDTQIEVDSGDEIDEAAQIFNQMVLNVQQLIEDSVQMEKNKQKLELQLFMYQINPHFIYNTLNSVIYLARKIHAVDIITLTKSFISFLQRTIKTQADMLSTIAEERKYIDEYVLILTYRYHDRIEVEWEMDADIARCKIPRMILYPLVENSIFHGFLPSPRKGLIRIRAFRASGQLTVSVEDNGIGMPASQLAAIRDQVEAPLFHEVSEHIGILNVNNRLMLLFGPSSKLRIDSEPEAGTRVSFTIPCERADP